MEFTFKNGGLPKQQQTFLDMMGKFIVFVHKNNAYVIGDKISKFSLVDGKAYFYNAEAVKIVKGLDLEDMLDMHAFRNDKLVTVTYKDGKLDIDVSIKHYVPTHVNIGKHKVQGFLVDRTSFYHHKT